ncbi:radical SAM protein [Abyssisolibacter fermentans]|uniref:radical SAM protein n=1 Tax=Abyssisolibacter fermentans TaxID=1766203 RepID=UPI00082DF081|nr:radical SAM protein [Abyssisolibacter fermentans]
MDYIEFLTKRIPFIYTTKGIIETEKLIQINEKYNLGSFHEYNAPINVTLELLARCNQKCIHCYNNSGRQSNINELTIEEWKNVCRQIGEMNVFSCVLSGGEPTLLGDALFDILDVLDKYDIALGMNTNGYLINEQLVKKFKNYNFEWVQVSIDGASEEVHNKIRGVDCWEHALRAADIIKRSGIPLVISHVINHINYLELEEIIDLSYILGAKKIVLSVFELAGRAKDRIVDLQLSDEQCREIYSILKHKYIEYRGKMEVQVLPESILAQKLQLGKVNDILVIRPDGNIKFNCFTPYVIGNIRENAIKYYWNKNGKNIWYNGEIKRYVEERIDEFITGNSNQSIVEDKRICVF